MESLDFVYDLTENLKKQNMDFVVIALQRGKTNKADIFYDLRNTDSAELMGVVLQQIVIEISKNRKKKKKKKMDTE